MESLDRVYKKNENFVFRKIENETILVPIKDNVGDMGHIYNLNEVAAFIWEHFNGKNSVLDIKKMLMDEFDASEQAVEEDLFEFVDQLIEIEAIYLP